MHVPRLPFLALFVACAAPATFAAEPTSPPANTVRIAAAAATHRMYIVCCSNNAEPNGAIYNTAFLLGRDGKEIGRYRKVCPTIHERFCTPGRTSIRLADAKGATP